MLTDVAVPGLRHSSATNHWLQKFLLNFRSGPTFDNIKMSLFDKNILYVFQSVCLENTPLSFRLYNIE